jgi:hypothetical protein
MKVEAHYTRGCRCGFVPGQCQSQRSRQSEPRVKLGTSGELALDAEHFGVQTLGIVGECLPIPRPEEQGKRRESFGVSHLYVPFLVTELHLAANFAEALGFECHPELYAVHNRIGHGASDELTTIRRAADRHNETARKLPRALAGC